MMNNSTKRVFILVCLAMGLLCGCAKKSESAAVVEAFYQALADQDETRMAGLVCEDWTAQAYMELDALQMVTAELQDFSCEEVSKDADGATVSCKGKIATTYNSELSEIDLTRDNYYVRNQGGEWLMCGTH